MPSSRAVRYDEFEVQAAAYERQGDWDAAAALYAEVYRQAIEDSEIEQAATALLGHGRVLSRKGCFREAEELARLCVELAERNRLLEASARAVTLMGLIRLLRSEYAAATEFFQQAREMARNSGDDVVVWSSTQNLGIIANIHGNFREARALYLESIGSAIRGEDRAGAMMTYANLGKVCVCLEDWLEAEVYFERGIEIAEQLVELPARTRLHANLAVPLIRTGEFAQARSALDTAEQLATRIDDRDTLSHVARLRGMIARLQGELALARKHLSESLRIASGSGFELARAEALEEKARLWQAEGHLEEACVAFEEACACFHALGARHDAARMQELRSQCDTLTAEPRTPGLSK